MLILHLLKKNGLIPLIHQRPADYLASWHDLPAMVNRATLDQSYLLSGSGIMLVEQPHQPTYTAALAV